MVAEILVARHGETDWNLNGKWQGHTDVPLNAEGVKQAHSLAEMVKNTGISRVYSSDLKRALVTAEIVSHENRAGEVIADPRLRERGLGSFEGLTNREVSERTGLSVEKLTIINLGKNQSIEQLQSFVKRIAEAFSEIGRDNDGQRVLVVAHGGVMMVVHSIVAGEVAEHRRFTNGELMRVKIKGDKWNIDFPSIV